MHDRKVVIGLTGGGTAGHVMPHLALLPLFQKAHWEIFYVGSSGIEKNLIMKEGLPFFEIRSGKLRRHFSFQNFLDIFNVLLGFIQSLMILRRQKPDIIFSKGGFVSVPVAIAAWCLQIPVATHESDVTPGLANRIITKFSRKIFCSFVETLPYLSKEKAEFVGSPVRMEIAQGRKSLGLEFCQFQASDNRQTILVMGGSQGAARINEAIVKAVPQLLQRYRIVHLTGKGKKTGLSADGYKEFEYVGTELKDIFAITDFVVCRAGANSLFELLYLKKPMLLIPLEFASRGDQVDNAKIFTKRKWALLLREKDLTVELLLEHIDKLSMQSQAILDAMDHYPAQQTAQTIFNGLESLV